MAFPLFIMNQQIPVLFKQFRRSIQITSLHEEIHITHSTESWVRVGHCCRCAFKDYATYSVRFEQTDQLILCVKDANSLPLFLHAVGAPFGRFCRKNIVGQSCDCLLFHLFKDGLPVGECNLFVCKQGCS